MQIETVLNRVQKFKSFVYGAVRWNEATSPPSLDVELRPRTNGWALCSGCGRRRTGYDGLPLRRFEFVPLWGMKVSWLYAPRRVHCLCCGIKVEHLPWVAGKCSLSTTYAWFLAAWGRAHVDLSGIQSLGIDEIA